MGQTVSKNTKCKDINILKKALQNIFGWDKIETLTPEQEKQGKRLNVSLYGGVKGNLPVVLKVSKENLTDKEGRKAVWSDFAVVRAPDGTLQVQTDLHNFDTQDKICFITDDMITGVNCGYAKTAVDEHLQTVTTETVQDWQENGDNLEKLIDIDEDEIPNIPQANYL
jgi:hypothetical protein